VIVGAAAELFAGALLPPHAVAVRARRDASARRIRRRGTGLL
jgi:hypothetical protein